MEFYSGPWDALFDEIRSGDKFQQPLDTNIDTAYQSLLHLLSEKAELYEPKKKKTKRKDVIHVDSDDDSSTENDPQYEQFLASLKQRRKSYVLESNKNRVPVDDIEYEAESSSDDERQSTECRREMSARVEIGRTSNVERGRTSRIDEVAEHVAFAEERARMAEKYKVMCGRKSRKMVKCGTNKKDEVRDQRKVRNVKRAANTVNKEKEIEDDSDEVEIIDGSAFTEKRVLSRRHNPSASVAQARTGMKDKMVHQSKVLRKVAKDKNKNVVNEGVVVQINDQDRLNLVPRVVKERVDQAGPGEKRKVRSPIISLQKVDKGKGILRRSVVQDRGPRNQARPDEVQAGPSKLRIVVIKKEKPGPSKKLVKVENTARANKNLSNQKKTSTTFSNQLDCSVQARSGRKIRNLKIADDDIKEENESDYDSDEVEILDSSTFNNRGVLSTFVASKGYNKSPWDEGVQDHDGPSASDDFRKRVLDVLRKPFDKEEYIMLWNQADKSYFGLYPVLEKKLKRHRYEQGKRLTILRGFFFWLHNLTHEGQFEPWKDRECLAVKPPSR